MTPKQLEAIYRTACAGKGYEGSKAQCKVWEQTIGWCEEADLSQALIWYFQANTTFPMPAELKPLSERARVARVSKNTGPKDEVRWRCPDCGVTMTGFIDPQDRYTRVCRGIPRGKPQVDGEGRQLPCGGIMDEIARASCAAQGRDTEARRA